MEGAHYSDNRLLKAFSLLDRPVRKRPSPLWAFAASTLMAGAACVLVWALLLGPQADLSAYQVPALTPVAEPVLTATEQH